MEFNGKGYNRSLKMSYPRKVSFYYEIGQGLRKLI